MPVVKLTQELLDSGELQCPPSKPRLEYCSKDFPGIYLLVYSKSDIQTLFYRYKDANGKTCHHKLGRTTDIDLQEARNRAKIFSAKLQLGEDPRAEENTKREAITFHDFFQDLYLPHAKAHKRTWKKDSERYNLRLKQAFGHMRLDQIKRHEVVTFHASLVDDGLSPAYADHFAKLLSRCCNLAVEWQMLTKNPACIKLFNPDNRIEEYLSEEELKRLLKVLQTDKNRTVCLIILFLLGTGARLNEVLQAKWEDIDMDNRVWRIPANNAKSRRSELIPYNSFVMDNVLNQLDSRGKYEHLFINRRTGKRYTTIHKTWRRIAALAELPTGFKLHSLRRSYASLVVSGGYSLYQASRLLRHSDPSITANRYGMLTSDSLRSATESVADALNDAMQEASDSASKVIQGAMKKSA